MTDHAFDPTHNGRKRALLLFSARPDDTGFVTQVSLLEEAGAGLTERDVEVYTLHHLAESESRLPDGRISVETVRHVYERFDVPPEAFMAILIGKDGTEKRREAAPVKPEALFATIDEMPMRQREAARRDGP